jgi:predicted deacetylase
MGTKYILRFDDITPTMSWSKFMPFKIKIESLNIKSILGVVPDCRDQALIVEPPNKDFFSFIRRCMYYGDAIAQHGTYHSYTTDNSGLLGINRRSEFASHSFEFQHDLIETGKRILMNEGVWQPWFMAPAHSYDLSTI